MSTHNEVHITASLEIQDDLNNGRQAGYTLVIYIACHLIDSWMRGPWVPIHINWSSSLMMALTETVSRITKGFIFFPWMNMLIEFMLHTTVTNETILAFWRISEMHWDENLATQSFQTGLEPWTWNWYCRYIYSVFQITASPSARSRQLWGRTGNFFKDFPQFNVYDLRFKAGGLTTFLTEFWTLIYCVGKKYCPFVSQFR